MRAKSAEPKEETMERLTGPNPKTERPHGLEQADLLVREAQAAAAGWDLRARRFIRDNPGKTLIGAVAIGFLIAKAARHA
jgi:hypothetical protein